MKLCEAGRGLSGGEDKGVDMVRRDAEREPQVKVHERPMGEKTKEKEKWRGEPGKSGGR